MEQVLTQATPINYVALMLSLTLFIVGTPLGRLGYFKKQKFHIKVNSAERLSEKNRITSAQTSSQGEQIQQVQLHSDEKKRKTLVLNGPAGCKFYLGYLPNRQKSMEIPEKYLVCEQVVNCLSK